MSSLPSILDAETKKNMALEQAWLSLVYQDPAFGRCICTITTHPVGSPYRSYLLVAFLIRPENGPMRLSISVQRLSNRMIALTKYADWVLDDKYRNFLLTGEGTRLIQHEFMFCGSVKSIFPQRDVLREIEKLHKSHLLKGLPSTKDYLYLLQEDTVFDPYFTRA